MNDENEKLNEPETGQEQTGQEQQEQEQRDSTSSEALTEKISELTRQIEKLEKMNQNLLIQQHVDDVDDSKLFSIFNRYKR